MPPLSRRLSGFTLLELLVVLVVSSLLFTMAYTALRLVQRQQAVLERKTALWSQLSTWQQLLEADFRASHRVEAAAEQLQCFRPSGQVTYVFRDSILTREQGETLDTLPAVVRQATYFWQGLPCQAGPVDEISLLTLAARDTFYLQATVHYAAQQLLAVPAAPLPDAP